MPKKLSKFNLISNSEIPSDFKNSSCSLFNKNYIHKNFTKIKTTRQIVGQPKKNSDKNKLI